MTPTSTTVVELQVSYLPCWNLAWFHLLSSLHSTIKQADFITWRISFFKFFKNFLSIFQINGFKLLDQRRNDICLWPVFSCLSKKSRVALVSFCLTQEVLIGFLPLRQLIDYGNIQHPPYVVIRRTFALGIGVAVVAKTSGFSPFFSQFFSLINAETVLFIGNGAKPKLFKNNQIWINAWVPTKISISLFASLSRISCLTFVLEASVPSRTNADTENLNKSLSFWHAA